MERTAIIKVDSIRIVGMLLKVVVTCASILLYNLFNLILTGEVQLKDIVYKYFYIITTKAIIYYKPRPLIQFASSFILINPNFPGPIYSARKSVFICKNLMRLLNNVLTQFNVRMLMLYA